MTSPLFYFLMGIVFVWVLSYFYNYQASRSKLKRIARWLNESLFILGGNPTSRWQGFNTLQILLNGGRGVIQDGAIIIGTQSKEMFAALVSLVRGGHDSLNFLFTLNPTPPLANVFEIFEAQGQVPRIVALSATGEWQIEPTPNGSYRVAYRTIAARDSAFRLVTLIKDYGLEIRRISLRSETPHLLLSFNLGNRINVEAHEFLQTIRNLAEEGVRGATVSPTSNKTGSDRGKPLKNSKKPGKNKDRRLSPDETGGSLTPRFGPPISPYYEPGISKNHNGHSQGSDEHRPQPPSLN